MSSEETASPIHQIFWCEGTILGFAMWNTLNNAFNCCLFIFSIATTAGPSLPVTLKCSLSIRPSHSPVISKSRLVCVCVCVCVCVRVCACVCVVNNFPTLQLPSYAFYFQTKELQRQKVLCTNVLGNSNQTSPGHSCDLMRRSHHGHDRPLPGKG